jgi:hypothetical protein
MNASQASFYLPVCTTGFDTEDAESMLSSPEVELVDQNPSPEEWAIKHNLFQSLSGEAKFVVKLILQTPAEIAELLSTKLDVEISKTMLRNILSTKFRWKPKNIDKAFIEISTYVKEIA